MTAATTRKTGRPRIGDAGKTIEAKKPWLKAGMSRTTWFRRQREAQGRQAMPIFGMNEEIHAQAKDQTRRASAARLPETKAAALEAANQLIDELYRRLKALDDAHTRLLISQ